MKLLIAMSISAIMLAYTVTAHAKEASNDLAQANNPIANMVALSLHNYYIGEFTGTEDDGNQFWLRYAQPFSLGESNWLMRASLPLNTFPFGSDGSSKTGLGDLSILTAYLIDVGNPGISALASAQCSQPQLQLKMSLVQKNGLLASRMLALTQQVRCSNTVTCSPGR